MLERDDRYGGHGAPIPDRVGCLAAAHAIAAIGRALPELVLEDRQRKRLEAVRRGILNERQDAVVQCGHVRKLARAGGAANAAPEPAER